MKPHPTQFGVRENSASQRQHDLRLATRAYSNSTRVNKSSLDVRTPSADHDSSVRDRQDKGYAPSQRDAATVERAEAQLLTIRDVAEILRVPVSWVYGRMRKRSREQLPAFRLGKYWRFRYDEVSAWIERQRGGRRHA
jgi:excisionase family DNA binding protein